ncbi:MAG: invasion associated locus B family protein [Hyphomicrobiaceae bacterium]|nr:invasion associated locus B family protein [Hyphomicrobiaceae bacterium]
MNLLSAKSVLTASIRVLAVSAALVAGEASAQQTPPESAPAPASIAIQPPVEVSGADQAPWIKVCNNDPALKKEVCRTGYDLRSAGSQNLIASMLVMDNAGPKPNSFRLLLQVPNSLMIQPGLKVKVDEDKEQDVKFAICFPENCLAAMDVGEAQITRLKSAKTFKISAVRENNQGVTFIVPMTTFKAAIEGQATPAEEVQKRDAEIQQKADDTAKTMEERLLEAQRKAQQAQ